jgi:APA family basic amino acid/polyamine antiporter
MPAQISLLSSVFLVVASMLGSGILTTTGSILGLVKSPQAVMAVWLIAGAHAVLGAYCYGIIIRRIPANGGEASILRAYFSPALGEIAGWVSFIVGFAASNAASAIGFGAYLEKVNPALLHAFTSGKWAALSAILSVTLLHSITGPLGIRIQTVIASLKFMLLGGLTLWGLSTAAAHSVAGGPAEPPASAAFGPEWGLAIMFSMFAYLGWSAAIYSAAETREARRTVPRAMLAGTLAVLLLYAGVNLALLRHIPLSELAGEKAVIELLVRKIFGQDASSAFSAFVAFALLSSLGASAFLGPRVLQAMLAWYRPHPSETTAPAPQEVRPWMIWLQALLSMAMILSGTFEQILTVTGFLLGIFPILAVLGLYTGTANAPEKVPSLARFFAAPVFLAGSLLILILGAMERPAEMGIASAAIATLVLLRHRTARHPAQHTA